uniref:Uncharacterized protein n=1 Tax=Oncorhynchus mykiss TaxID=8022 RepID=A0A8C7VP22_ONCMY
MSLESSSQVVEKSTVGGISAAPEPAFTTAAAGNGSLPPPPTMAPAIPPYVKLGLTVAYTVFYSLLFAFIYAQLWLVLRYRHKRFSYQTAFLFLCLLWAALRALLFSFYFRDCVTANTLGPFAFWLLYCFPVCLQFFTLSLMNLYCAQVRMRSQGTHLGNGGSQDATRAIFGRGKWWDGREGNGKEGAAQERQECKGMKPPQRKISNIFLI